MILKNGYVYSSGVFQKRDLHIKRGVFVHQSDGPIVDMRGLYVFPGFVDSHAHIIGVGQKYNYVNLEDIRSEKQLLEALKNTSDEIIRARNWHEDILGSFPTRAMLDQLDRPAVLTRKCGHVAVLNTAAMKLVNIYKEDGVFKEGELEVIRRTLKDPRTDDFYKTGEEHFLKHGVTFVHSDDFHGISEEELISVLQHSRIRVFEKVYFSETTQLENFPLFGKVSERAIIGGVKIFADGSLGGRTAYLSHRYRDDPDNYGMRLLSCEEIERFASICSRKGLQLCVHAIGDAAVHEVALALQNFPNHRIIHAQFVNQADLPLLKNALFSVQPHFAFEDEKMISNRLAEDYPALMYPFLELKRSGFRISFSTDAPVSPEDPKYVIRSALKMGFSVEEAVELYTTAGAEMAGIENLGRLEVGYLADFSVYERNPLLLEDDPVAVFVKGEKVFEK